MLSDIATPEKEVAVRSLSELQDYLEIGFKTSYHATSLDRMRLVNGGLIQFEDQEMPCTPSFLDAIADAIQMPIDYAYKLEFGLYRENFEQRKDRCCKAVTICSHRGVAINLADAEYRPARTVDVLPGLADASFWTFGGARISDRGVEINYIQPGCAVAPIPDDIIELGIRISNSETGYAGLKASLFSLRLVCSNGAVLRDELGTARWNYDRRVVYSTSIEKFQNDLFKLKGRQELPARLYHQLMQRNLLDSEVVNLIRRLRTSLPAPAVDTVLGLPSEERQAIQAAVRQRAPGVPSVPTVLSSWDVHNRITAAAQRLDFVRRSRLERIGGGLLGTTSLN